MRTFEEIVKKLEEGATEGPWRVAPNTNAFYPLVYGPNEEDVLDEDLNVRLIAFLRNILLEVREVVRSAQRLLDETNEGMVNYDYQPFERLAYKLDALDAKAREFPSEGGALSESHASCSDCLGTGFRTNELLAEACREIRWLREEIKKPIGPICEDTFRYAVDGECPVHHGDACLRMPQP